MSTTPTQMDDQARLANALVALRKMRAKLESFEQARSEPIAVIGIGCRFPGHVDSPAAFWQLLRNGVDAISEVPSDRWDLDTYYDPNPDAPGKMYSRWGGFVDNVGLFDPQFFGIAPREARNIDPQQRLLLEVTWEALEHAGQAPHTLAGSQTGVFVGISCNDYSHLQPDPALINAYRLSGNAFNAAAGRISYVLGLQGPCMALDTACSSSLVGVHLACQSLRTGESDLALAGGVNLILSPEWTITACKNHMLSPDGRCKTFDAAANGFVRGEGCGVVVLKRLSDALAAGDNILAVIRGSATNQDGFSSGFTVPNKQAQEAVIRRALANANIEPGQVSYVEAHGTGTSLGDPIEMRALAAVFGQTHTASNRLVVGSAKTNIGHTESAAGIAGLIKVVLALQNGEIPPHLHFNEPSPHIVWNELAVEIPTRVIAWPAANEERIAGVSAFGGSGINAHVVLAAAPPRAQVVQEYERPLQVLPLSARNAQALDELAQRYESHLSTQPQASLSDVCYTAGAGRSHFAHRMAVVASSVAQAHAKLAAVADGQTTAGVVSGMADGRAQPGVAFLFTGQGAQYAGMARELYETQAVFRQTLDDCDKLLRPYLPTPLLSALYPQPPAAGSQGESKIDETAYTQPALFALEYALAELWRAWGVHPTAVIGHSIGEYVAACVAGVFSLEDGLKLVAERGRLMQSLPRGGKMAAIFADEVRVNAAIAACRERVSVAAVNGPTHVVISGAGDKVEAVLQELAQDGIKYRNLAVSHAFHSPLMEPALDDFERAAQQVHYSPARMPLISNITGRPFAEEINAAQWATHWAAYWRRHARQAVQFAPSLEWLYGQGTRIFVEIGPSPTLSGMGRHCLPDDSCVWLPSLRQGKSDWQQMLESLAALYVHGVDVDWQGLDGDVPHARRRVTLPTYPFQRERYWIDMGSSKRNMRRETRGKDIHPLLGLRVHSAAKEIIFEAQFNANEPSFLADHRIHGEVVLPAAAYIEMAQAAGVVALHTGSAATPVVEDLVIHKPLILSSDKDCTVQVILERVGDDVASLQICSLDNGEEDGTGWQLHVSARVRAATAGVVVPPPHVLEKLKANRRDGIAGTSHYQRLRERGFEFSPAFQGLQNVWRDDDGALGEIKLPEGSAIDPAYHIQPVLLDAALQVFATMLPEGAEAYVPMGLAQFRMFQRPCAHMWSYVSTHRAAQAPADTLGTLTGDMYLLDDAGQLVAVASGLAFRVMRPAATPAKEPQAWLYETVWQPQKRLGEPEQTRGLQGNWLIFGDDGEWGQKLAEQLNARGVRCVLVYPGAHFESVGGDQFKVNPACAEDFRQLMHAIGNTSTLDGIIHSWAASRTIAEDATTSDLHEAQTLSCASVLHLVQALATTGRTALRCGLWLLTRGAQPVEPHPAPLAVAQAPLWGLGTVIAQEFPELRCMRIDLDPAGVNDDVGELIAELGAGVAEDQVAFRGHARYVARLKHWSARGATDAVSVGGIQPQEPIQLESTAPGVLENLVLRPAARRRPGPGEVEIQVHAAGLNFRDVLNALGMYPGDAGPLGGECAGTIVAIGPDVQNFRVGDDVMAVTSGSFRSFVTVRAESVARKPAAWTFAEAATIPVTFLTAHYALHRLAHLSAHDRVLIHSAAGGVGMAAVQLALTCGAEVFGTAGNPEKRAALQSLGVQHVMDSRTLDFAGEITALTGGAGVTVVLNSLTGEFIPKSLAVTGPHGRFLEIGKRGIWDEQRVAQSRPDVTYSVIDLGAEVSNDPELMRSLFDEVLPAFEHGALKPLPLKLFPLRQAVDAFRYMAQAKHIGKIVIALDDFATQTNVRSPRTGFSPDATYLLTGAFGGIGLEVARWLIQHGARHLALVSRRPPSEATRETLREMEHDGAQLSVFEADVAHPDEIGKVMDEISRALPPLHGVFHLAGVVEDAALLQQDWPSFRRVLSPKVEGAWNLHRLTLHQPLDYFVLFGSAATLIGSPGQANYVAANAFLGALAHYRRTQGLPALSIDWGPWSNLGMMSRSGLSERMSQKGIDAMTPQQGLQALEHILHVARSSDGDGITQVGVLPVRWPRFAQQVEGGRTRPYFAEVIQDVTSGPAGHQDVRHTPQPDITRRFRETPPGNRRGVLITYVHEQAAAVLGLPPSAHINSQQPLQEIGLDSLMAVELRNKLAAGVGCALPVTLLFECPSIEALTDFIAKALLAGEGAHATTVETQQPGPSVSQAPPPQDVAELEQLSEREAEALLLEELRMIKRGHQDG